LLIQSSPVRVALLLGAVALGEAQILIRLRVARVYAELAGPYLAAEVEAGLAAFPVEDVR
jgi:hypothetical protein